MHLPIIIFILVGITNVSNCNYINLYNENDDDIEINIWMSNPRRNQQVYKFREENDGNEEQTVAPIGQADFFQKYDNGKHLKEISKKRRKLLEPSRHSSHGMWAASSIV